MTISVFCLLYYFNFVDAVKVSFWTDMNDFYDFYKMKEKVIAENQKIIYSEV